jgi:hypothetical protein
MKKLQMWRRGKEREKISVAVTADIYVGCEGSTMSSVCELDDLTDWSVLHSVPFFSHFSIVLIRIITWCYY